MRTRNGTATVCVRGHKYRKSGDTPVCPVCWPGYYKTKASDRLPKLSAPATRALLNAKISSLPKLAQHTEVNIRGLHGMGPSSIPILRKALKAKRLSFKK